MRLVSNNWHYDHHINCPCFNNNSYFKCTCRWHNRYHREDSAITISSTGTGFGNWLGSIPSGCLLSTSCLETSRIIERRDFQTHNNDYDYHAICRGCSCYKYNNYANDNSLHYSNYWGLHYCSPCINFNWFEHSWSSWELPLVTLRCFLY